MEELAHLGSEKSRRIFVAWNPLDLRASEGRNSLHRQELPLPIMAV